MSEPNDPSGTGLPAEPVPPPTQPASPSSPDPMATDAAATHMDEANSQIELLPDMLTGSSAGCLS